MAGKSGRTKKSRKSGGGGSKAKTSHDEWEDQHDGDDDERLTLEALDAISTDSEHESSYPNGGRGDGGGGGVIASGNDNEEEEWDAEAAALRRAIAEGAFDKIGIKVRKKGRALGGDSEDDNDNEKVQEGVSSEEDMVEEVALEDDSSKDEDDGEEDGIDPQMATEVKRMDRATTANSKALNVVANELSAAHSSMAWSETFTVVPSNPLPFGGAGGREGNALDIHDDLKREVAFYNTAMEAVIEARAECERIGLPFRRPDDFFAEMVKTDGECIIYTSYCIWHLSSVCLLRFIAQFSKYNCTRHVFVFYIMLTKPQSYHGTASAQITWPRSRIV